MEQLTGLIIPLGLLAILYFMIIRPQQKKEKKVTAMRSALKVGDEIITIGGVYGKIIKIKEDVLTIEVGSDKTKLVMARWAVGSVVTKEI
ncbi:preprotein translocase subunit YajC [Alkaliphilus hydrothermalis]|uniref:Preprotein translocase subunit YajC n=1 Tax=Alkaliphilus hydrothermalis TaxID=1482730 RepID=A0ABS2NLX3_9FIRM|nr:preprotein translocase subunit YajC [Alkaliphilus hydrothermalis]MBM7613881.1 preprotein translocase subunit YajC [Alkaliphilus hydrothermalis]